MSARRATAQLRLMGRQDYVQTWTRMRRFTEQRTGNTPDALWVLEHPAVYTQGQAGRPEHLLAPGAVPVVHTDRGGQVTYHGPGQCVVYVLLDLKRLGIGVKTLVGQLESAVIALAAEHGIEARRRAAAPGVYVAEAKLAALGLRIRRGCSYHGVALNVDMDLEPFRGINPCGYQGLAVTQLKDLGVTLDVDDAGRRLAVHIAGELGLRLVRCPESGRAVGPADADGPGVGEAIPRC